VKHPVQDEYGNGREKDISRGHIRNVLFKTNTEINAKMMIRGITWIKVKHPVQDEYRNKRENDDIT
jgi:hypothetical protein